MNGSHEKDSESSSKTGDEEKFSSLTEATIASWIIFSSWCVITGLTLSMLGELNRTGYALSLFPGLAATAWPLWSRRRNLQLDRVWKSTVWRQPVFFIYLACLILSLAGGLLHEPNNYDALVYRLPRLARWLDQQQYHWIGHFCSRMDFSSLGYEWLMMPGFAVFHTLRLAFIPNIITLLLLPAAVRSAFTSLGISRSVSSFWMWAIPCASCFVMQSGGIGNDITASVYLLAAILFTVRAGHTGKMHHLILAALAAGLMTNAKTSNLPLLLPIGICGIIALYRSPRLWLAAVVSLPLFAASSIVPLAVMNTRHAGHWTGSPDTTQNLNQPFAGIAGNALQIGCAMLNPPLFPFAGKANKPIKQQLDAGILSELRGGYPQLGPGFTEMVMEEGAGLGLGLVIVSLLWMTCGRSSFRCPPLRSEAAWVAVACGIALLVVMAKLGNAGVPRIIAPYYPVMFVPLLLLFPAGQLPKNIWFSWASAALLAPILIVLVINPARPLLRPDRRLAALIPSLEGSPLMARITAVYDVYSLRSNLLGPVRNRLADHERVIGFAGDDCDSEYFFWLPVGQRKVVDFKPLADMSPPTTRGLDAIVVSETGSRDRFGLTPQQLAGKLGWKIDDGVPIRRLVSMAESRWYVLRPEN